MDKRKIHSSILRSALLSAVMACVMAAGVFAAETGVISGDVVNARKGPGTGYERVEMLAAGKQVTILGEENGWYKIQWNDSVGYVLKEYVRTGGGSGSASQTPNATVTGGSTINVRSGPGTEYSRVTMVAEGKRVAVLDQSGSWCKVSFDGTAGYILADYVRRDGSTPAQTSGSQTSGSQTSGSQAPDATVTGGSVVNVRSGPGTDYDRVTTLAEGKRVAVLDQSGSWCRISVDGATGYIYADFLTRDGAAAANSEPQQSAAPDLSVGNATVTGGSSINVRSGPGTGYNRVATVAQNKRVTLLAEEGGWFKVSFDGATGYILGTYLAPDSGALAALTEAEAAEAAQSLGGAETPTESYAAAEASSVAEGSARGGFITGGTINIRTGPGTGYDRITTLSTGKRVTILGEEDGWFKVSYDSGTGYVLADYIYEGDSLPASSVGEQVAQMVRQFLGTRYVYGGAAPGGFDCSGLTMYLYRQFGYSLPHTASGQYANCGYKVSKADLQPGDLVFFTSSGSGGRINHVAVYVGNGEIIHARYSVGEVHSNYLSESYYAKNYVGAIRIA